MTYHEWLDEVSIVRSGRQPEREDYEIVLEDLVLQNRMEARPDQISNAIDVIGILYNMGVPVDYDPVADIVEHLPYPRSVIGWVVDDANYGTRYSFVQNFVPQSIDRFTLVKNQETMMLGANMPEVVVSIRTKTYDPDDPYFQEESSNYTVPPFVEPRKFYSPKYDHPMMRNSTLPDIRKTLFWEPHVKLDENGNASVVIYNGDRYTNVRCILEGITDDGTPVYSEFEYEIGLNRE